MIIEHGPSITTENVYYTCTGIWLQHVPPTGTGHAQVIKNTKNIKKLLHNCKMFEFKEISYYNEDFILRWLYSNIKM
jgi:hypothetical protein